MTMLRRESILGSFPPPWNEKRDLFVAVAAPSPSAARSVVVVSVISFCFRMTMISSWTGWRKGSSMSQRGPFAAALSVLGTECDNSGLRYYGDNESPWVDITLYPQDNWKDVLAAYVRKNATPSIFEALQRR